MRTGSVRGVHRRFREDNRRDRHAPCSVYAEYQPQIVWYSHCGSLGYPDEYVPTKTDKERYYLRFSRCKRNPAPNWTHNSWKEPS